MSRTKRYGDPQKAARLREVRAAKGFRSARAAAFAHGWSASTYTGHENGGRALTEADLGRYAEAFAVDPAWLRYGGARMLPADDRPEPDERHGLPGRRDLTAQYFMGVRLAVARRLAGFRTASEACRFYGFRRGTYGVHEWGLGQPLTPHYAEVYAAAYGVEADWLLRLSGNSLIPEQVAISVDRAEGSAHLTWTDEYYYRALPLESLLETASEHAAVERRGSQEDVARLIRTVTLRRAAREGASHRKEPPTLLEVELSRDRFEVTARIGRWVVPDDFVPNLDPGHVLVVRLTADLPRDEELGRLREGDRLLVDTGPGPRDGVAVVIASDGRIELAGSPSADQRPLGTLLATMRRVAR